MKQTVVLGLSGGVDSAAAALLLQRAGYAVVGCYLDIGLGGSGLIIPLAMRTMSPEERREVERGETDERNVYIRARAAQDSWYWTLALLWVPFVAALVQGETLWMVLCPAVIVLHCAFYMFHMYRWSKKL